MRRTFGSGGILTLTLWREGKPKEKMPQNYQFSNGILYYKRAVNGNKSRKEEENWRICVRTEEEKQRILESCHAGAEGVVANMHNYH